jgi:hypothetical protein
MPDLCGGLSCGRHPGSDAHCAARGGSSRPGRGANPGSYSAEGDPRDPGRGNLRLHGPVCSASSGRGAHECTGTTPEPGIRGHRIEPGGLPLSRGEPSHRDGWEIWRPPPAPSRGTIGNGRCHPGSPPEGKKRSGNLIAEGHRQRRQPRPPVARPDVPRRHHRSRQRPCPQAIPTGRQLRLLTGTLLERSVRGPSSHWNAVLHSLRCGA